MAAPTTTITTMATPVATTVNADNKPVVAASASSITPATVSQIPQQVVPVQQPLGGDVISSTPGSTQQQQQQIQKLPTAQQIPTSSFVQNTNNTTIPISNNTLVNNTIPKSNITNSTDNKPTLHFVKLPVVKSRPPTTITRSNTPKSSTTSNRGKSTDENGAVTRPMGRRSSKGSKSSMVEDLAKSTVNVPTTPSVPIANEPVSIQQNTQTPAPIHHGPPVPRSAPNLPSVPQPPATPSPVSSSSSSIAPQPSPLDDKISAAALTGSNESGNENSSVVAIDQPGSNEATTSQKVNSDGMTESGKIALGVVGGILGLALILFAVFFILRRRHKKIQRGRSGSISSTDSEASMPGKDNSILPLHRKSSIQKPAFTSLPRVSLQREPEVQQQQQPQQIQPIQKPLTQLSETQVNHFHQQFGTLLAPPPQPTVTRPQTALTISTHPASPLAPSPVCYLDTARPHSTRLDIHDNSPTVPIDQIGTQNTPVDPVVRESTPPPLQQEISIDQYEPSDIGSLTWTATRSEEWNARYSAATMKSEMSFPAEESKLDDLLDGTMVMGDDMTQYTSDTLKSDWKKSAMIHRGSTVSMTRKASLVPMSPLEKMVTALQSVDTETTRPLSTQQGEQIKTFITDDNVSLTRYF